MELITNQTQENILSYAHEIVENGYTPGILIIDDGWQKRAGVWDFDPEKFSDPKKMVDELHALGFTVMIWVTPFVCPEGRSYAALQSFRIPLEQRARHLVRLKDGTPAIYEWWNGYAAMLNFCLQDDREFMTAQLEKLMGEYGIDGFKFDGGTYKPNTVINGDADFYGGYTADELNAAWIKFGSAYKFHEFKDTFNAGGLPVIQRLFDKNHSWKGNGIDCLLSGGMFVGLIGSPFICPDMVGGGEWTAFLSGNYDEELFVRMAQASALFPMMQFSSLPWRHLSKESAKLCLDAAKLHESFAEKIEKLVENAEKTGEPIIRYMEYSYPHSGFEKVNDQFMLGDNILVAPVIEKGQTVKNVKLPAGKWRDISDGKIYVGGTTVPVPAPIDKLPVFERI